MAFRSEVSPVVFVRIKSGQQIIESRLNDGMHKKIKIDDLILFVNRDSREEQLAKVVGLLRYDSFAELFNAYTPGHFGAKSEQELLSAARQFYTPDQEIEAGVLGIKLHVLRP